MKRIILSIGVIWWYLSYIHINMDIVNERFQSRYGFILCLWAAVAGLGLWWRVQTSRLVTLFYVYWLLSWLLVVASNILLPMHESEDTNNKTVKTGNLESWYTKLQTAKNHFSLSLYVSEIKSSWLMFMGCYGWCCSWWHAIACILHMDGHKYIHNGQYQRSWCTECKHHFGPWIYFLVIRGFRCWLWWLLTSFFAWSWT